MKLIKALLMMMPFLFAGSVLADDHNTVTDPVDETVNDAQDILKGDKPAEPEVDVKKDMAPDTDEAIVDENTDEKEEPMD
ncbi:hypothetical protein CC99x_000865 [Candidatus Berkiella cookevillensis]|uniref:Uncharacterized protein n=1 Tax=Candidatus Berkiella cookevillensis TaxID=437022 RepID=A0A0Q9YQ14_9GAMM|nr:hypothetical protein [Candidatus Berkiella cookevillensis]MCS5707446.1 hypothetical protein [Candidatus Berkiella cookevillensis]